MRTLFSALLTIALLITAAGPVAAQSTPQDAPGDTLPAVSTSQRLNLMEPIQNLISGPGWLMAQGLDVRPHGELPEASPMTGPAWSQFANPAAGLNAPDRKAPPVSSCPIAILRPHLAAVCS
ncbi:MAG: hypothetical protein R2932_41585 [Caldilineaceae bacterium]